MTILLDGRTVRDKKKQELHGRISTIARAPSLAIIQVGNREDSSAYIAQKTKMGEAIGVSVTLTQLEQRVSESKVYETIDEYNNLDGVDGIIIQLPLPEHLDAYSIIERVDPAKDVDGLHSTNVKKLHAGRSDGFIPATAKGIVSLLDAFDIPVDGRHAVVVGRSILVGKPAALYLLSRDATVTVAHSKTASLASVTRAADILIVAAGAPQLIGREHVREKQVVVDVGINLTTGERLKEEVQLDAVSSTPASRFVGDVDFEAVQGTVAAISPVPGGVGPMTVVSLFENLVDAYERRNHL